MKLKTLYIFIVVCLLIVSGGTLIVKAESNSNTNVGLKASIMNKFEKKDVRNPLVEKVHEMRDLKASTTAQIRDIRREDRDERKDMRASTTMMVREISKEFKGEQKEMMQKMQVRVFETRKNALARELATALNNLTNIRARISERITKAEVSGKDMADAKAKLVIADAKLATAKTAVDVFAAYNYSTSTTSVTASSTASTTIEVNLDRPRKVGDDAIKAVKSARDAFKDVVVAIAHGMGLGNNTGVTATTTATTTDNGTSTSTASTTSN